MKTLTSKELSILGILLSKYKGKTYGIYESDYSFTAGLHAQLGCEYEKKALTLEDRKFVFEEYKKSA